MGAIVRREEEVAGWIKKQPKQKELRKDVEVTNFGPSCSGVSYSSPSTRIVCMCRCDAAGRQRAFRVIASYVV